MQQHNQQQQHQRQGDKPGDQLRRYNRQRHIFTVFPFLTNHDAVLTIGGSQPDKTPFIVIAI